jgi:hypothetical protein
MKLARAMVTCAICKRDFARRVPRGGDGSGDYPAFHKFNDKRCEGVWTEGTPAEPKPIPTPTATASTGKEN